MTPHWTECPQILIFHQALLLWVEDPLFDILFLPGVRGAQCPGEPLLLLPPRARDHPRPGVRLSRRGSVVSAAAGPHRPDQREEEEESARARNHPRPGARL